MRFGELYHDPFMLLLVDLVSALFYGFLHFFYRLLIAFHYHDC